MTDRWVVDADHPEGHAVPMTEEEEAQRAKDAVDWAAVSERQATFDANAAQIRKNVTDHMQDALTLADALDGNTATPAQQRAALALCLRGTVRLARLTLELYDDAP